MVRSGIGAGPQAIPPSCCDSSNTRTAAAESGWHAENAAPLSGKLGQPGSFYPADPGTRPFQIP